MSKRQQLIDKVKERFATITTANGYASNVGQKVFEWQTTPVDPSVLPCTCLNDPIEKAVIDNKNSGEYPRQLTIVAALLLAEADQTAVKARQAIADVITAIGTDQRWSQLAIRTLPESEEVMVDKDGTRISGARITFQIEFGRAPWTA